MPISKFFFGMILPLREITSFIIQEALRASLLPVHHCNSIVDL
jgi:hypothetical protein